jgi:small subunit ribosomal protein S16
MYLLSTFKLSTFDLQILCIFVRICPMLIIRLQRVGRVHEPTFRIVLTDSKFGPKSGKAVEVLGSYDARKGKGENHVDGEKVKYWISKGAQVSDTVHNFLVDQKVLTGKKINVLPKNKIINANKAKKDAADAEAAAKAPKPAPAPAPEPEAAPVEAAPEEVTA